MSYTIEKSDIIKYPPEVLNEFEVTRYEWIDNLHFTLCPADVLRNPAPYIEIAEKRFLEKEWEGDGEIRLMWVPPFALSTALQNDGNTEGMTIWYVKQTEDGTTFLLHEKGLFPEYDK